MLHFVIIFIYICITAISFTSPRMKVTLLLVAICIVQICYCNQKHISSNAFYSDSLKPGNRGHLKWTKASKHQAGCVYETCIIRCGGRGKNCIEIIYGCQLCFYPTKYYILKVHVHFLASIQWYLKYNGNKTKSVMV